MTEASRGRTSEGNPNPAQGKPNFPQGKPNRFLSAKPAFSRGCGDGWWISDRFFRNRRERRRERIKRVSENAPALLTPRRAFPKGQAFFLILCNLLVPEPG
jgi:hypothetical protein